MKLPGMRVQFPVKLFVTVPLQGALETLTNNADLWFDFLNFFKKGTALWSDIESPAVARLCFSFGYLLGGWMVDGGWGELA